MSIEEEVRTAASPEPRRSRLLLSPVSPPGRPAARENRRAVRRETHGQGAIRVPGYRLSLPCRIADTSATGARLELRGTSAHHLPDRVVVVFAGERTEVDAVIKWRTGHSCGVQFVSPFRTLARDG
jgi:hypothetical protein